MEKENGVLEEKASGLERTLSQAQDMKQLVLEEKEAVVGQKAQLEADVRSFQGQLSTMGAEAEAQKEKEKELLSKLEHLAEVDYLLHYMSGMSCWCVRVHDLYLAVCCFVV